MLRQVLYNNQKFWTPGGNNIYFDKECTVAAYTKTKNGYVSTGAQKPKLTKKFKVGDREYFIGDDNHLYSDPDGRNMVYKKGSKGYVEVNKKENFPKKNTENSPKEPTKPVNTEPSSNK